MPRSELLAGQRPARAPARGRAALSLAAARAWGPVTWGALALLLACGVAVRVWLIAGYGPVFAGFGDEHEYVSAAAHGVFQDVQKPAGYPVFLALLHLISARLALTVAVQHLLGLGTGLLLFDAVRRSGAPPAIGLLPAAVAFLGGTGLLLEHSLLADPLYAFLQAAAVDAAVAALAGRTGWALLAGAAAGASFWVKTVGLCAIVLIPAWLALARSRRRLRPVAAAAAAGAIALGGYVLIQGLATGYWGYERQGAWNLYGRVAMFVDCSSWRPPAGTRFLCPAGPPASRAGENYYQYAPAAPAVRRYGGPARAPGSADGVLLRFSVAAIAAEPLRYAGSLLDGLGYYVSPRPREGYTPTQLRQALLEARGARSIQPALASYYRGARGDVPGARGARSLASYEADTRLQGVLLVAILVAALLGPILLRARARAAALLLALSAVLPPIAAEAGAGYDARYGYPALAPLAGAAALGAWGVLAALAAQRGGLRSLARRISWRAANVGGHDGCSGIDGRAGRALHRADRGRRS